MKNITKIIIGIGILLLLIGVASAVELDDFKAPATFGKFNGGQSINEVDSSIRITVYDFDAADYSNDEDFDVTPLENNTYKVYDKTMKSYGVQEKINKDGKDFTVYISGKTDFENLQGFLNQFNKENNLEPVEI
ncbi:hypothetical protein [uncultured Methanobrevibacter sp.]|uniref:hypothetical protein n=1 Tax=uncultured Methanobrevibacter sp. TaxID=253161 RepID=UPI0025FEBF2C|nr:hypothetical protein [uncultured Methanobrevibacter sp.]